MDFCSSYAAFNGLYEAFILKLCEFFPAVKQLRFYHELFLQFRKVDAKLPARLFLSSVAEHSLHIFNKNDVYFMGDIEVTKTKSRAIIEKTIVREWTNMSDAQKETVWFYLQQMLLSVMNIGEDRADTDLTAEEQAERVLVDALVRDGFLR